MDQSVELIRLHRIGSSFESFDISRITVHIDFLRFFYMSLIK
jgi:hypothetical protein